MKIIQKICIFIGLLLLAAAACLTSYNLWREARARASSAEALAGLLTKMEKNTPDKTAADALDEREIPDYLLNPEKDMPVEEINGQKYIGVLKIPDLSLELPVISEWSYPALRTAPCRYKGSIYQNNMIIAAHNYSTHFGNLKNLKQGAEVSFTDVDGNVFYYEVVEIETLNPYAIEEMESGDWDLTLFTCTLGGQSRVTVRCQQVQKTSAQD